MQTSARTYWRPLGGGGKEGGAEKKKEGEKRKEGGKEWKKE